MTVTIAAVLGRLSVGQNLTIDEMSGVIDLVMRGEAIDDEIAALLTALRIKGESVEEIAGAAMAMRRHMRRIGGGRSGLLDTCGTGGDGSRTFNISTAAALVAAAAGVPVAKHGNRAATSRSGSADVLAALGVNVDADLVCVERCLDELGICFCFAPLFHPAIKQVGPLANPAGASFQLLGVGKPHLRTTLAEALALLGVERGVVVCGEDRLDEVTISGPTRVTEATREGLRELVWQPEDFGLKRSPLDALIVDSPDASAAMIRSVLAGDPGPPRDIVVANAAAALWTVGKSESLVICANLAAGAIDSGKAGSLLKSLGEVSNA
jgi:anthranilate phosphoribosyltransferase